MRQLLKRFLTWIASAPDKPNQLEVPKQVWDITDMQMFSNRINELEQKFEALQNHLNIYIQKPYGYEVKKRNEMSGLVGAAQMQPSANKSSGQKL